MRNPRQFFRGKHADLCVAISEGRKDDAFNLIYGFFRSEDNTDSYSISLLTMMRELLENNDSDEMYKLRVRLRANGDKVLINLVQFLYCMHWSKSMDAAVELLGEKIEAELPKLSSSMEVYVEEEGLTPPSQMQGLRIHEAVKMLAEFFEMTGEADRALAVYKQNLEMTRLLLFNYANFVTDDLLLLAQKCRALGYADDEKEFLREIVENYDESVEMALNTKDEWPKELNKTLENLSKAYKRLDEIEHEPFYVSRLQDIASLYDSDEES